MAYDGLMMLLQQEWQFIQHAITRVRPLFAPLEVEIKDGLLPELLGEGRDKVTIYLCNCTIWGVKREGIGISYPTQTAPSNFKMLKHCCEVLTDSMINGEVLEARSHVNQMRKCYKVGKDREVNSK